MQNADQRNESAEQFNAPTPASADLVRQDLDKGNLTAAERAYLDNQGIYTDAELQEIDKSADNQLRNNSPEDLPEGPLNEEQAESAMKAADDNALNNYQAEHKPGAAEILRSQEIFNKNNEILSELEASIGKIESQGTQGKVGKLVSFIPYLPAQIVGDIFALMKSRKMKKKLAELQDNLGELQQIDGRLKLIAQDKPLDPDKISPGGGHIMGLVGTGSGITGVHMMLGAGAFAKATLASTAAASPVGLGLVAAGGVLGLVSFVKKIMSWRNISKTKESLQEFKKAISDARTQNGVQKGNIDTYIEASQEGARENIQQNFPGTLAA